MENLTELRIHKILAGPFSASEHDPDWEVGNEDYFWVDVLVEINGNMEDITVGHDDFDKIYPIVSHLSKPTLDPYIINLSAEKDFVERYYD